ncbi:branched-chain amino acid ABC transporter permease [Nocardioides terrisoli]|uniref:branched-chain amino acid ABC transporter permease n=1 Tax=Nocardioides terrisoli TaxID=3388267 RepID=UPI00287B7FC8|nr:branched-chain amino acid ABC transporter permease [Nocardioides marmorisolisilvae]
MHTRPVRLACLALAAMAVALLTVLVGSPAQAASPTCVRPPAHNDETIHVQGCLLDARHKPATPVPGVTITVTDEAHKVVGKSVTDQTGIFDITLPGKAIDILGHTFTVHIDSKSLPHGTKLRNPKQESLPLTFNLQSDRYVTFPIGNAPKETSNLIQGIQLAVGGLVFSFLLAMASLGLSLIFGTTGLVNFAHGELITFGAMAAFAIDRLPGNVDLGGVNVTMVAGIITAIVLSTLFGWAQDKILWGPLRRKGVGLIAAMIVSIGLSIFLRNIYQYVAGADTHNYTQWTNPSPWNVGQVSFTPKDLGVVIFSAVVLVLVCLAIQRTRIGKATRAVSDNPALAASSGINVDRVISVVWSVGAGLAGLSGVLLGMTQGFDYQVGFKILLLVFAAVVLGGLGSVWGALLGSFIIGIFIEVSTLVIPAELKFVGALVVLIVVLLIRPQGLLGRAERVG